MAAFWLVASWLVIFGFAFALGWAIRAVRGDSIRQTRISHGSHTTQIQGAIGGVGVSRFAHGRASVASRADQTRVDLDATQIQNPYRGY